MEALIATLIGALLGFSGAYLKYHAEIKKIKAQYLSANRKAWMNRVVEKVVDYVASVKHNSSNKEAITRLHIQLELLLNPTGEDSDITDTKTSLIQELENIEKEESDTEKSAKKIVYLTKKVLSHEWGMVTKIQ